MALIDKIKKSSWGRKMATGILWSLLGAVLSRGMTLVATVLIARMLGKEVFGQWGLIMTVIGMFVMYASFGISNIITKHITELKIVDRIKCGNVLSFLFVAVFSMISIASILSLILANWLANDFYKIPELKIPLMFSGLMIFGMVGNTAMIGSLAGFNKFSSIAFVNSLQALVLLLLVYPFIKLFGLTGAVIAMSSSYIMAIAISSVVLLRCCTQYDIKLRIRGIWREKSIIWRQALPIFMNSAMIGPALMWCRSVVSQTPGGVAGMGSFTAAYKWREIVLFFPATARQVVLPVLSELKGDGDKNKFVKAMVANIVLNGSMAIAGAIPLAILSKWIMSFYGDGFADDWLIMVIMVFSAVLISIKEVFSQIITSMGRLWFFFWVGIFWAITLIVMTKLLVPAYGILGYVLAEVASTIVDFIFYGFFALNSFKLHFRKDNL